MTEKQIEQKLCSEVKALGGMAIKLNSLSMSGLPDRLVLLPKGKVMFVELKSPGKKPNPKQVKVHSKLKDLGFDVYVVDGCDGIREVLNVIKKKFT